MKKKTQKIIMTLIIVFLLGASTIAFVAIGGNENTPQEIILPDKQIIDGYLSQPIKEAYLQKGYTIMEYHYYIGCCKKIGPYIDFLPDAVGSQLIIQKIEDKEYYINLQSVLGREEKIAPEDQSELLGSLCNVLSKAPIECGLLMMNQTSTKNTTK
ncbi:MAG: hypothetical protein HZB65_05050 [Candidatus Aenigmarchaeota archaeon]|nr:hypothetical protein [Candidatus Aenigmarchaeota archaeon]